MQDTIYALASGSGRAGVAVLRLSGPDAFGIAGKIVRDLPVSGTHKLRVLRKADDGAVIDQALVLNFSEGASFTGESVVEFQCHGSPAVVQALGSELSQLGARPAERGEFTRRALENGVLDLTQVEGLADLIDADTESQRAQAFRVMQGDLSSLVQEWRTGLVRALALLAANIDFADEEIPDDLIDEVGDCLKHVSAGLRRQLAGAASAQQIRAGFQVAIVGRPNAGKSTLFNYLVGSDAAITSSVAGTTRDVIEIQMDIRGHAVTLMDTAGLRDTDDVVEALGVDRARKRAAAAELRIVLLEPGQNKDDIDIVLKSEDVVVRSKRDVDCSADISGITGEGVSQLLDRIAERADASTTESSLLIRERHLQGIKVAAERLDLALALCETNGDMSDLISEEVRLALGCLDVLIGKVGVEELLGEIFSSFCIGK